MMSFLSSIFLLALPLAAVPVIIHLLNRRQRNVIRWGAMQFLIEAATRRRRWRRVDDLLLMLLRTAAVLVFILALARPLLKTNWFGSGPRDVIVILDTSMSTAQTADNRTVFDELLQKTSDLIGQLNDGDIVRVMSASSVPQWLVPAGIPANTQTKRELCARLTQLEPTLAGADMCRCVLAAIEAEPANEKATRVITVLTDDQSYSWRTESGRTWQDIRKKLESLLMPAVLNVVTVGRPDRETKNLSVDSVVAPRALAGVGETITLSATIKNTGSGSIPSTLVSWEQAENSLGVTSLPALTPGQTATVRIEHSFDSPGVYEVRAKIDCDDDLLMDNIGRFVLEVVETMPILIIDDMPQADPLETETGYLLASLGHSSAAGPKQWRSVFKPTVADSLALAAVNLSDYSCVVLANVSRLPAEVMAKVTDYVRQGGGLWVVLSERLDRTFFNEAFFNQGNGLSPLPLDEPVGKPKDLPTDVADDKQNWIIRPPLLDHQATRLLADTERLDINRARIYRRHCFAKSDSEGDVSILLRTAEDAPLAIENVVGRGRVIIQAVPMNVRWSNLALLQAYVVMVHEWLWYLAEPTMTRWNIHPGEEFSASLPKEHFSESAAVTSPFGVSIAATSEVSQNRRIYGYGQTQWPGHYELVVSDTDQTRQTFPFNVRRDVRESDLSVLTEKETEILASTAGFRFVADPLADTETGNRAARAEPAWTWLLVALLALMLIELIFAGISSKRRLVQSPRLELGHLPFCCSGVEAKNTHKQAFF